MLKSSGSPTTGGTTAKIDYWEHYNQPDNPIRKLDEEHGIKLVRDAHVEEDGSLSYGPMHFVADPKVLYPEAEVVNTFPEFFRHRSFMDFSLPAYGPQLFQQATEALKICVNYHDHFEEILTDYEGKGLYFWSKTRGSGKTYLSTILGAELSHYPKRIRWYSMPNLLQEIKEGYDRESGLSSSDVINIAKRADVLMLDDIGVEKQSAWVNETVFNILDHRLVQCKPTIFTSNMEPDELDYDERIKDRIKRMTEIVHMPELNVRSALTRKSRYGDFLRG